MIFFFAKFYRLLGYYLKSIYLLILIKLYITKSLFNL